MAEWRDDLVDEIDRIEQQSRDSYEFRISGAADRAHALVRLLRGFERRLSRALIGNGLITRQSP